MKQSVLFAALGLAAFGAGAQEVGNVISSVPVIQQVQVPRQHCQQAIVTAPPQTSGAGGLVGALAGGALGSTIGHGTGTAAAVLIGTVGGAILGNNLEAGNAQQVAVPHCVTETAIENRTVGYDVTYEYGGRQFSARMPYDPGRTVQLNVSPVATSAPTYTGPEGVVTAPGVVQSATVAPAPLVVPAPVVYAPYPAYPAYPVPVYRPYYPPVGISLGFTFGGHRHRHWRHRH